jgi:hypothetical protein
MTQKSTLTICALQKLVKRHLNLPLELRMERLEVAPAGCSAEAETATHVKEEEKVSSASNWRPQA